MGVDISVAVFLKRVLLVVLLPKPLWITVLLKTVRQTFPVVESRFTGYVRWKENERPGAQNEMLVAKRAVKLEDGSKGILKILADAYFVLDWALCWMHGRNFKVCS
jgi:hypothetical protein